MRYFLAAMLCFAGALAFSQTPVDRLALGLTEAQNIAYDNNQTLQDQSIDVEIAESQVDQTLAQGLPQVTGNFDYQWNILNAFAQRTDAGGAPAFSGEVLNGFSELQSETLEEFSFNSIGGFFAGLGDAFVSKHQATAGVNLNQQVFDGVYLLGIEAARVFVELSEVQLAPTRRDIEKAVEKAYYGTLITQENLEIVDGNIKNLSDLIFETKEIYKAGFAEQLDVDRLELSLAMLENQKKNLLKIEELNYDILKNAMTISLDTDLELTDEIESFEAYVLSEEFLAQITEPELWPEFKILDVQEEIQGLDIERIEKGKLPKVDAFINGNYNYQGNDFIFTNGFDNWFPNVAAGLSISVPIFDGNLRNNQIRQKQLELQKIQLSRETLQTSIDIQIENALTAFANATTDIETQKDNIALAQKIYNTTQIKYREGVGSSVELYQAQQDLYTAQQGYINSLYDLLIAKVDVERALGK